MRKENQPLKKLLVIGSTCVDVVLRLDHLPSTGEDLHPYSQHFRMGGCAYNVAKVAHANTVPLHFVTPVGCGIFGDFVWSHLEKDGFTGPVRIENKENGCCYCFVEKDGERTFLSVHGIEYSFDESYVKDVENVAFYYTYISGLEVEEPTGDNLIDWLTSHPNRGTVLYAPGPRGVMLCKEKTEKVLALHPILHLNASEVITLADAISSNALHADSDQFNVEVAARVLYAVTQNMVIVTLGKDGVFWLSKDGTSHSLPGIKTTVVDTIGAGDSHCGAVLTGLCLDLPEKVIMKNANAIAATVVSKEGATLTDSEYQMAFLNSFVH